MAPSIRLLVYYITYSEATSELVADSVWLDVRAKCVNGLQVRPSTSEVTQYRVRAATQPVGYWLHYISKDFKIQLTGLGPQIPDVNFFSLTALNAVKVMDTSVPSQDKEELLKLHIYLRACVFQTDLSYRGRNHKPQDELQLDIQTNEGGLVALAAADSALFTMRPNYRNPLSTVTRTAANKIKTVAEQEVQSGKMALTVSALPACRSCATLRTATWAAVVVVAGTAQMSFVWLA